MHELNILEHYLALSISSASDSHIYLKSEANASFINNNFMKDYKLGNQIQPIFNHHKAVTYMFACSCKAEDETSNTMKQTAEEASASESPFSKKMKVIAKTYMTNRENLVQEAL